MRTVAFHLPQFHRIPENDRWWGDGFTEWTNVRRARPQFEGHVHPRVPSELGQYDLTDADVLRSQSDLACSYGVDAFCFYFYWFDGRRLLERPVDMWRQDESLLPYCLSWANESWTRRWDGKSRDVLMPQRYQSGYEAAIFEALLPHFEAPHYLRQGDAPILLVHRVDLIPDAHRFADTLRKLASDAGLPGIHLVAAETKPGLTHDAFGFDAVVQFPPVGANTLRTARVRPLKGVDEDFRGRLMSYDRLADDYTRRVRRDIVHYPAVAPGWDNTARRQSNATIYVGATPERYGSWLAAARESELEVRGENGLVFINAWNEWAEGAYLEPDQVHGRAFLEKTRAATAHPASRERPADVPAGLFWSRPHLRSLSLAIAGSLLASVRRTRNAVRASWRRR